MNGLNKVIKASFSSPRCLSGPNLSVSD
uniref:Uncharacterized protein n=1 Tax=Anguilla anguilla TaxID=7936 RepID=A0A0E9UMN7_ANGAN